MVAFASSAALIGLLHSLAPGHWLPLVLLSRARRWSLRKALLGALVSAGGHVLTSIALGVAIGIAGNQLFDTQGERIERLGGLFLAAYGALYCVICLVRHHRCEEHAHHGPPPVKGGRPFLFLFTLGLSPCLAVAPVFGAAGTLGWPSLAASLVAFCVGVVVALAGATWVATRGLLRLDHPILEHYGEALAGAAVAVMGLYLVLFHDH